MLIPKMINFNVSLILIKDYSFGIMGWINIFPLNFNQNKRAPNPPAIQSHF